jgi:hypothetical protein
MFDLAVILRESTEAAPEKPLALRADGGLTFGRPTCARPKVAFPLRNSSARALVTRAGARAPAAARGDRPARRRELARRGGARARSGVDLAARPGTLRGGRR